MSGLTLLAHAIAVTVAVLTLTGIAHAACLSDDVVAKLVAGYPTTPVTGISANLSLDDAYRTQAKYVALLEQKMGPPVGYKVGFTGKATQEQFKIPSPAMGVLFEPIFVPDRGSSKRDFDHRSLIEPDLMVVVKDEGIMDATTELEAAAHLDTVHAYPVLLDLLPQFLSYMVVPTSEEPQSLCYRFVLSENIANSTDLVIEGGAIRLEAAGQTTPHVTFECDTETFLLLMWGRLAFDTAIAEGRLSINR